MVPLQLLGVSLLGIIIGFVIPLTAGFWVYVDASDTGVPYPAPVGLSIAALFFAGLLPGVFGALAYLSLRDDFSR